MPDSNNNEHLSNRNVLYQINHSASNQVGDVIHITANIYFDFNEPVVTNTTVPPIVDPKTYNLSLVENQLDELHIYPNQFSINWTFLPRK